MCISTIDIRKLSHFDTDLLLIIEQEGACFHIGRNKNNADLCNCYLNDFCVEFFAGKDSDKEDKSIDVKNAAIRKAVELGLMTTEEAFEKCL